ncbi:MAG TPA: hypothetical protein VHL11_21525 [Phototrophicaceae bacterium]|jgi:hypothetical protein|nr:hypothetical protein [Phototrophicaceae bacterium]
MIPPKPKRIAPHRWQIRLLDLLRLSSSFEVKIRFNAEKCADYLAKRQRLRYRETQTKYAFEINRNSAIKRFSLTEVTYGKNMQPGVYLVGELKEEPNLDVTTITIKIYPRFYAHIPWLGLSMFMVALMGFQSIEQTGCYLGMFVFIGGMMLFSIITNLQKKLVIKSYFLACLKDAIITPDTSTSA